MSPSLPLMQRWLLRLHTVVQRTGLLRTGPGKRFFETCYLMYKRFFEARHVTQLRQHVRSDHWVIDVGANIGFFTDLFARWIDGSGRVLALEPEADNCTRLKHRLSRHPQWERIDVIQLAAAQIDGQGYLQINPDHPADHRLAGTGHPVTLIRLDTLLASHGWPRVSLVKIDVQGAEDLVLLGGRETIARWRPALFVELTEAEPGSQRTMALLNEWHYRPHILTGGDCIDSVSWDTLKRLIGQKGYLDCLFLPEPRTLR